MRHHVDKPMNAFYKKNMVSSNYDVPLSPCRCMYFYMYTFHHNLSVLASEEIKMCLLVKDKYKGRMSLYGTQKN